MSLAEPDRIVTALRAIPGVLDADVEPDGTGLGQVRLELVAGANEAVVAAAAGALLRERFGVGVDLDNVQILEDAVPARPAAADPTALAVSRVEVTTSDFVTAVAVTVEHAGVTARGEADATTAPGGVRRAIGTAALRAAERLAAGVARFDLDHIDVIRHGDDDTVLASVTMVSADGARRLAGCAPASGDGRDAVIRAVLDAATTGLRELSG